MSLHRREFLGAAAAASTTLAAGPAADEPRASSASATAWPQFKGDARRSGDNPHAVLSLPLQRITAVRFPRPIYASPAVVDGRVYVQDAHGHVAGIDARRNAVVWAASIGGVNNTSSPAVMDGVVFIGSSAGALMLLDVATGRLIQRVPANGPVLTAPAIANDAVYFSTLNGRLTKLDRTGKVVWHFDGGRTSSTEFAVHGDRLIFFAGTDNTIQYLLRDAGGRAEILEKRPSSGQTCPTSGPVFLSPDDYAYQCFDSEFGTFYVTDRLLDIDAGETRATPSFRGGRLYRGDKCWDLEAALAQRAKLKKHPQQGGTLVKPLWRVSPEFLYDGGFHSSPALARDVLVIGAELGQLHCISLEGVEANRKPLWSYAASRAGQPNGGISSSPAVIEGAIFFGGEDGILHGLGRGKEVEPIDLPVRESAPVPAAKLQGREWPTSGGDMGFSLTASGTSIRPPYQTAWRTRLWSTFKCPMIVADGKVFASGRGGLLAALDASTGAILWKTHHPGVESRPGPTFVDGRLVLVRSRSGQRDSPHVIGASGGPEGEGLWCHDAGTGARLWHRPLPFAYHFNADGLPAADGKVFFCTVDEQGEAAAVAASLADGKDAWRTPLPDLKPGRKALVRFSGVLVDGLWCVSIRSWSKGRAGATLALDIKDGKIVWRTEAIAITERTCLAARNGVLIVFADGGCQAFEPRTGKRLWTASGKDVPKTHVSQALTDLFLDSKGQKGLLPAGSACNQPIFANGLWYSHDTREAYSSNKIVARDAAMKIVWETSFLSNACPSPVPAYERLYYSPNAEGVIYCLQSAERPGK